MRRLKLLIFNRLIFVGIIIMIQLYFLMKIFYSTLEYSVILQQSLLFLSVVMVIYILNKKDNPSFQLAWCILILALPLFGGVAYLLFGGKKIPKMLRNEMTKSIHESNAMLNRDENLQSAIKKYDEDVAVLFNYVQNCGYYPYYDKTQSQYYPSGEVAFEAILKDLKQAKHFIFLEFFIIKEGKMWNEILEVLQQKVQEDIEVYVMYDDAGCVQTLPYRYEEYLNQLGIKCVIFNKLEARLAIKMNNRDHRKLIVIDNQIAYFGGINLSDEYINEWKRFGYWKDSAIRIEGKAVWSATVMFIQFYNAIAKRKLIYQDFKIPCMENESEQFILPFSDSPTDDEQIGKNIHINLINKAKKYIYIHTPYLIIDYDMTMSLTRASKNGVEVIITTPAIPDKKYVFAITRNNYQKLLKAGVKIYEFTPGFLHSKNFVCDDLVALVGTINMDYRSYYLHYECGVLVADKQVVLDVKEDYLATLKQSKRIYLEDMEDTNIFMKMIRAFLNIFAPLM